jgi:hypothetical protein
LRTGHYLGFPRLPDNPFGKIGGFSLYGYTMLDRIGGIVLERDGEDGHYFVCLDSFILSIPLEKQTEMIGCAQVPDLASSLVEPANIEELLTHPVLIVRQKAIVRFNQTIS